MKKLLSILIVLIVLTTARTAFAGTAYEGTAVSVDATHFDLSGQGNPPMPGITEANTCPITAGFLGVEVFQGAYPDTSSPQNIPGYGGPSWSDYSNIDIGGYGLVDGVGWIRMKKVDRNGACTATWTTGDFAYWTFFVSDGATLFTPIAGTTATRFISILPVSGTTVSTTTNVGGMIYAKPSDFANYGRLHIRWVQDGAMSCINSGAVIDAVTTCAGANAPRDPIDVYFNDTIDRLLSGVYTLSQSVTFTGGGKWNGTYEIQQVSTPWYLLGLVNTYNTIVSTTTQIIIGYPSPIDVVKADIASSTEAARRIASAGIGAILASTTASVAKSCNLISTMFSIGDCITLLVWPGSEAMNDNLTILKQLPPWGYAFRFVDLLNATTSTTTLPVVSYTFATSSAFADVGEIHFDPFGAITEASTFINTMKSDRPVPMTVWQIFEGPTKIFVFLVLFSMMLHDISGVYKHAQEKKHEQS